jgi:hypothetical protein
LGKKATEAQRRMEKEEWKEWDSIHFTPIIVLPSTLLCASVAISSCTFNKKRLPRTLGPDSLLRFTSGD